MVPSFLRGTGKVRNRCMPKSECEALINAFWAHKIENDTKPNAPPRVPVIDHLGVFLRGRSGIKKTVVEIAYNFVDALKRYSYDADCELFHRILFGELCEDVYHDQMQMLDTLLVTAKTEDAAQHGGRSTGAIGRSSFIGPPKPFFPRLILPNFSVLARACLWCLGARMWRVNLPSCVKSTPICV